MMVVTFYLKIETTTESVLWNRYKIKIINSKSNSQSIKLLNNE